MVATMANLPCNRQSEDRWFLAEATTDSIDAVATKVVDLAVPRDLMSVASDLRQSALMGEASQTDAACSLAFCGNADGSSLSWWGRSIGPRANMPRNKLWSSKAASCILWLTRRRCGLRRAAAVFVKNHLASLSPSLAPLHIGPC
jgi:hypothetical protein